MKRLVVAACLALVVPVTALAQKTAVSVLQLDKAVDVSKFRTYEWTPGHKALDPAWDKAIIAAVEKELAAKGLTKGSPGDVLVAYHAVQRADVDLSTFDQKSGVPAQMIKVGTLAVELRDPATRAVIWRVAGEGAIKDLPGAAERDAFAAKMASALFEKYPAKK